MSESIDFIGYFVFFWLFLFNKRYRATRMEEWQEGGWLERAFMLLEAASSFLIGAVVPGALLWAVFQT
jgi:hypothetical protein